MLSRNATDVPAGAEHHRVDLTSGEGLAQALAGVDAVVDAANSTKAAEDVLVAGTRRLLEAEAGAGVATTWRSRSSASTRCRSPTTAPSSPRRRRSRPAPSPSRSCAPPSSRSCSTPPSPPPPASASARPAPPRCSRSTPTVVAARLADAALAGPAGRLPNVAGPKVQTLSELSRAWATARGKHRLPLRVPSWGKMGKALAAGALCDPAAADPGRGLRGMAPP